MGTGKKKPTTKKIKYTDMEKWVLRDKKLVEKAIADLVKAWGKKWHGTGMCFYTIELIMKDKNGEYLHHKKWYYRFSIITHGYQENFPNLSLLPQPL